MNIMVFIFAFFAFVYMIYVGGFFIKQQKQEFLTYRRLGMSKLIIAVIGFVKTFIIQILAWIIGMILALILQKFVGMLLVYLMRVKIDFQFYFTVNIVWLMLKVGVYSSIFLSVINAIRSYLMVRNGQRSRKFHLNNFFKSILGILGVLMFLVGLTMMIALFSAYTDTRKLDSALASSLIIILLFLFGTYFIFIGFFPMLLDIFDRMKSFSYRGLNLFSVKYLRKRLIQNTSIIWFVTELSALAIGLLLICYASYQVVYQNFVGAYPFQISTTHAAAPEFEKEFAQRGTNVKKVYHSKIKRMVADNFDMSTGKYRPRMISLMSYSDYQKLPDRIKDHNPKITANDFLELKYDMQSLTPGYRSTKYPVKVKNAEPIKARKVGSFFPYGTGMFSGLMFIVPNSYFNNLHSEASDTFYGFDIKGRDKFSQSFVKKINKKEHRYLINVQVGSSAETSSLKKVTDFAHQELKSNDYLQNDFIRQADAKSVMHKTAGFFTFLVMIFSIALLVALGSLLTLKVLLRDDYDWHQLKTLKKIGVSNHEIKQIVKKETTLLFGISMLFTLLQSIVVVGILNLSVNESMGKPFLLIGLGFIILYGLVGFLTYQLSWRGVKQKI